MINGKRLAVVMPAYNAARTLMRTYEEIPRDIVDDIILVDDASQDETVRIAQELGIHTVVHQKNTGYGGNQKTCYRTALELGADIVVMLHPDYQYTPKLIYAMSGMIAHGVYDVVLGSRILGKGALAGGMPLYKFMANRLLTLVQNICLGRWVSEYHTGFRAFSRNVLLELPLEENSNDFVFDNEILVQVIYFGYEIAEITCPAKYFPEASSTNVLRSLLYGLGVLATTAKFLMAKWRLMRPAFLRPHGRKLLIKADDSAAKPQHPHPSPVQHSATSIRQAGDGFTGISPSEPP